MRWYTRNSNLDLGWGGKPIWATETVLQYRQQYDATMRAGMWTDAHPVNLQWSEWQDVPQVVAPEPSYT